MNVCDRIAACLKGIATGDAIGKQTESLSRADVLRWYPQGIRGFEGPINGVIPRYGGNSKRNWRFGETTDDTERTIAVARAIIATRAVSHVNVGREMLRCVKGVHPGVPSLWEFHQAADPGRIATVHDGCGAAIRVTPVGILYTSDHLHEIVNGAHEASISTHGGSWAIAAAAATAGAVSAAIDGASGTEVLNLAARAAACAEQRWPGRSAPAFANAIRVVHNQVKDSRLRPGAISAICFPNGPLTIVPLALTLATVMESCEDAILLAANVGGDSDSVASIAGGILGARYPDTVNEHWYDAVETVNKHQVAEIAKQLAALRPIRAGAIH
jgi:ADP-ribosylglycohydrolase